MVVPLFSINAGSSFCLPLFSNLLPPSHPCIQIPGVDNVIVWSQTRYLQLPLGTVSPDCNLQHRSV